MRITRANDPLNITVHDSLIAKFKWVLTQAKELGIPPPPELSSFGIPVEDRKRKRTSEILQQVFFKENIVVDGMNRNLAPPLGVEELHLATMAQLIRLQGSIIRDTPEAEEVYNLMELEIESREDAMKSKLSTKHQLAVKGLFECKALESNIRRIQVKDIVKEVEDHLKIYSSAGMDMSWSAVSISSPDKFACKLDSLIKFTCSRSRYGEIELHPIARYLFHKDDELFLNYSNEDDLGNEPACLIPIIPMLLVNRADATAVGCQGKLKKYDTPKKLLEDFYRLHLDFYKQRKTSLLHELNIASLQLKSKERFAREVLDRKIDLRKPKSQNCVELRKKYDYLISQLTDLYKPEYIDKLEEDKKATDTKLQHLNTATPESL
ncbi:reverse transcriptase domain-containing protein [Tanacetum coccineum]